MAAGGKRHSDLVVIMGVQPCIRHKAELRQKPPTNGWLTPDCHFAIDVSRANARIDEKLASRLKSTVC